MRAQRVRKPTCIHWGTSPNLALFPLTYHPPQSPDAADDPHSAPGPVTAVPFPTSPAALRPVLWPQLSTESSLAQELLEGHSGEGIPSSVPEWAFIPDNASQKLDYNFLRKDL